MATQQVYFVNPNTVTNIDTNVSTINTNVSSIISNNTIQFKKGNVGDLSKLVPDYEWEWRKLLARAFRFTVVFGSEQGVPTNDFFATHISARLPTGWKNGYVFTGPMGPTTGFNWKFTLPGTETVYDTTNNLRDLVGGYLEDGTFSYAANMNKKALFAPRGSYFDEVTASSLLRVDFTKPFDPFPTASHIDYVLGTGSNVGQTWMKNNGVVVFGAAYTVHRPFYLQDPTCHSIAHLHASAENVSLLSNGVYPFSQELMTVGVHTDYLDYDGYNVDLGPPFWTGGPPFGTKISENYNLFMNEWNSQITNTGAAVGFVSPGNLYSWYCKKLYILKHHGLLTIGSNPNEVCFSSTYYCNHFYNQSQGLNNFADVIKDGFLYPPTTTYDSTGYALSTIKPTFVSPELSSYLSSTGTNLLFRAINGGVVKTFLKHDELDAYYSGNTGGYNTAWGGHQAWGVIDPAISAQYNAMKLGAGLDVSSTVSSGAISSVTMLNMGTGYVSAPSVVVTGNGTGAQLTANLTNNYVSSLTISTGGFGYTTEPTISFYGGGGLEATCTIGTVNGVAGAITSVTVVNGGVGLADKPRVVITSLNGLGSGAVLRAEVKNGSVWRIIIERNGSGYTLAPRISFYGSSRTFFTSINRPEYFSDAWSNPFIRSSVKNPNAVGTLITNQDMSGQDIISRQLPGCEF